MATANTLSAAAALLKINYDNKKVEQLAFGASPLLAMLPKDTKAEGLKVSWAAKYGYGVGRSQTFATAKTKAESVALKAVKFELSLTDDYAMSTVANKAVRASKSTKGAFIPLLTGCMDDNIGALGSTMARDIYGDGWGVAGVVGSFTGSTITLSKAEDATNFMSAIGQDVVAAASNAAALRNSGAVATLSGVDLDTGVLTFSAAVSSIAALANGDNLYFAGDRPTGAAGTATKCLGFNFWTPTTISAGTDASGVDRSVSPFLHGPVVNYSSTGGDVLSGVIDLVTKLTRLGGRPTHIFMNDVRYGDFCKILQSEKMFTENTVGKSFYGSVSFDGIKVRTSKGTVEVYPDPNCPVNEVWGLQMDAFELISLGDAPGLLDDDGNQFLRQTDDDGILVRSGAYWNLKSYAPCRLGKLVLPTRT